MNSKVKILIADDDQDDKEMLIEGLSQILSSFEVETVCDGVECLRAIKTGCTPDLVFLDLNMPLKNGIECLRDIFNNEYLPNTPVIVYSTSQNLKDINKASEYGARFYLVKPPSFTLLQQSLKYIINLLGCSKRVQQMKENFVIAPEKINDIISYQFSYQN